jgi:hypothetical protein
MDSPNCGGFQANRQQQRKRKVSFVLEVAGKQKLRYLSNISVKVWRRVK